MITQEQEIEDLVLLISKKAILFPAPGKDYVFAVMQDYYSGEIPEDMLEKYVYIKGRVQEEKKRLMKELYEVMWGNLTFLEETKTREMKQVKGGVLEKVVTRRPVVLPTQLTLHIAEQALKIHSGTVEVDVLLEGSTILEKNLIEESKKEGMI
ncbi:MAG: hypothetical protein ACRCX2_38290 [Paraclostridium sp.]